MKPARALAVALLVPALLAACASNGNNSKEATATTTPAAKQPGPAPATHAAAKPAPVAPAATDEPPVSRSQIRVRFGIMPDYAYNGAGVMVDDVSPGTSAADAGIQSGDILSTWNGKKIDDIYKWMEYMAPANPGDVVDVGVVRKGQTVPVKVTLKPAE